MWDFSIGRSLGLMGQTLPFIVFRMVVYFGIAAAYVLVTGIGVGVGWGVGAFGGPDFRAGSMAWGGIIGFGLTAGTIFFLREYILYIVKAGHIAVLVELLDGRGVPAGQGQIAFASEIVKSHFAETNVLFGVDLLVRGVLAAILGLIQGITAFLPIPGLQNVVALVRAFLRVAIGLMDEVVLGYLFRVRTTNPWYDAQTARRALRPELQGDAEERRLADHHHVRAVLRGVPGDAGAGSGAGLVHPQCLGRRRLRLCASCSPGPSRQR